MLTALVPVLLAASAWWLGTTDGIGPASETSAGFGEHRGGRDGVSEEQGDELTGSTRAPSPRAGGPDASPTATEGPDRSRSTAGPRQEDDERQRRDDRRTDPEGPEDPPEPTDSTEPTENPDPPDPTHPPDPPDPTPSEDPRPQPTGRQPTPTPTDDDDDDDDGWPWPWLRYAA